MSSDRCGGGGLLHTGGGGGHHLDEDCPGCPDCAQPQGESCEVCGGGPGEKGRRLRSLVSDKVCPNAFHNEPPLVPLLENEAHAAKPQPDDVDLAAQFRHPSCEALHAPNYMCFSCQELHDHVGPPQPAADLERVRDEER